MIKWLAVILLTAATLSPGVAEVFYVTPAPQPCPSSCHTLDQYAQNETLFEDHANVTLIFLCGQHILNQNLTISGMDQLSLQGEINCTMDENKVSIDLQVLVRIALEVSTHLLICDVTLRSEISQQSVEIRGPTKDISLLYLTLDMVTLNIQQAFSVHMSECKGNLSVLQFVDVVNISIINTEISGAGSTTYNFGAYCTNFGIQTYSQAPISTSLIIQNTNITNYWIGVFTNSSEVSILITNTRFEQNGNGVSIRNSQGETILTNTHFIKHEIGILLHAFQGRTMITNTQVIDNTVGIYAIGLPDLAIQNCTISSCEFFGVLLIDTDNASIIDSYVTNNRAGITSIGSTVHIWNTTIDVNAFGMIVPAADLNIF